MDELRCTVKRDGREFLAIFGFVSKNQHTPPNNEACENYVDARHLAKKYRVSSRHILILAEDNRIPSLRLSPKCIRFSEAAVAEALRG